MSSEFSSKSLNSGAQDFLLSYLEHSQIWLNSNTRGQLSLEQHDKIEGKRKRKEDKNTGINDGKELAKEFHFLYWEWNSLFNEDSKATLQTHESSLLFNVCKRISNTLVFIRSHRS
jgi:hypothetical protein